MTLWLALAVGVTQSLGLSGTAPHDFTYLAPQPAKSVFIAGTFNQWNGTVNPMHSTDGRTWRLRLSLPIGRHQYKYVIDGEQWVPDPTAKSEVDGGGNRNSLLLVLPTDYDSPARIGDGMITRSPFRHPKGSPGLNWDQGRLSAQFILRPGDVQRIEWVVNGRAIAMRPVSGDEFTSRVQADTAWDRRQPLRYAFLLKDGATELGFGPNGAAKWGSQGEYKLNPSQFHPIVVPAWTERAVMYQIFPDRFANGSRANDHPATEPWTAKPSYINRFGGDAAGVRQRIPYLQQLGISTVYFNPIMMAPSNHRYDPVDFYRVDPEFGTNREFGDLTRALDRVGIRVVLDQIFDHVGTTFSPFADVLQRQQDSRFLKWFFINEFPVAVRPNPPYQGWYGNASMPKLNPLNPDTQRYLLESVDYWHREAKLAGWRLDVANEVPMEFWRILRQRVKAANPDIWILGEEWGDASAWLQGDQWDASMNYPFRTAVIRHIAEGHTSAYEFIQELLEGMNRYAPQVARNQMNLISSHDVPRFRTVAKGDLALAHLAAIVQMTWVGMPSVYYGDELGMEGGVDPDNRRPMRWDTATQSNPTLQLYRRLIVLRKRRPELTRGRLVSMTLPDSPVAAYARVLGPSATLVLVNRSSRPSVVTFDATSALGKASWAFRNALTGTKVAVNPGKVKVTVPAKGSLILSN